MKKLLFGLIFISFLWGGVSQAQPIVYGSWPAYMTSCASYTWLTAGCIDASGHLWTGNGSVALAVEYKDASGASLYIPLTQKGAASGVASLDASSNVNQPAKSLNVPASTTGTIVATDGTITINKTQSTLSTSIYWNSLALTKFAQGLDATNEYYFIWDASTNADIFTVGQGGKIKIGATIGDPSGMAAQLTVKGATANSSAGAFGVTSSANSGLPGTPFLLYVRNDGNVGIGKADAPAYPLDVSGTVNADAFIGPLTGTATGNVATVTNVKTYMGAYEQGVSENSEAATCNWANGSSCVVSMEDASSNWTLTMSNPVAGQVYRMWLIQNATGGAGASPLPTFSPTVTWAGGSAPTLTTTANKWDIITCYFSAIATKGYLCDIDKNF